MRLWTVHPQYLDTKGILAAWREGLLAQKVLQGKTKGYRNHPQLERFKNHPHPLSAISVYLHEICNEADRRGYLFQRVKVCVSTESYSFRKINVPRGQLVFEFEHLLGKLEKRSPEDYERIKGIKRIRPNPVFRIVPGSIASWERVNP